MSRSQIDTNAIGAGMTYLTAQEPQIAPTLSPLEQLQQAIEAHVTAERDSLQGYREIAERDPDPIVRLLLQLVLDDELRHHELLRRIAARLRDDIEWRQSDDALPSAGALRAPRSAAEIARVSEYVREERSGARHLHDIARRFGDMHQGVISLLLDSMARDSEKHERILRFVLRRLTSQSD